VRDAAAERFDEIELEIGAYFTFVMDDPSAIVKNFAKLFSCSEADMLTHPHALFGSVDAICDELVRRRELYGISYITVPDTALEPFAPVVERLSGK
jgi:hypothetical protein